MQAAEQAKTIAMAQGQQADTNRVESMQNDIDLYTYINCSPFTQYGTGMYAGQAASNWNAINTAVNGACPTCAAQ